MARSEKRIMALDAETDPFLYGREPKPFVWGLYDGEQFNHFWGDNCNEQLIEYLQDEEDIIIYAHNGGRFDYFFLLDYLDPDLSIINGRIAKATLFGGKIELRDSYLILPLPLSENKKDDIDYQLMEQEKRNYNKTEIINYLKTDCLSLYNWVSDFRNEFGSGLTLAGSAFKELGKTEYPKQKTFESYDEKFRPFYFGGRVQCFETGAFKMSMEYVDINSAYPDAMMRQHWCGSQYMEHLKLPELDHGSWFAEIDAVSRGALPVRVNSKLYFPDDNQVRRYKVTGWEINAGLETGTLDIHKVFRSYRPLFTHSFDEYVNKFFAMKLEAEKGMEATKGKNPIAYAQFKSKRQFAKLMLNSCYGKFGQDGRKFENFYLGNAGEKPDDENYKLYSMYGDKWIFSRPDPANSFYNVCTAASVTGYVRAYLWRSICQSEKPLYCDTDSIICGKFHGPISDQLGDWDLEAIPTEAYIAQRKMYAMKLQDGTTKVASKGVRLTYEQIKAGVVSGQSIRTDRDAPAFSLKYGARFTSRETNFENIDKNSLQNPPLM